MYNFSEQCNSILRESERERERGEREREERGRGREMRDALIFSKRSFEKLTKTALPTRP